MIRNNNRASNSDGEKRFRRIGHGVALFISLVFAVAGLVTNSFNVKPHSQMCYYADYPPGCAHNDDLDTACERGGNYEVQSNARTLTCILIAAVGVFCTIAIYIKVRSTTRSPQDSFQGSSSAAAARRQKAVATQAILYTLVYLNSCFWMALAEGIRNVEKLSDNEVSYTGKYAMFWLVYFFVPLQGALNFVVYIRPRYHTWRGHLRDRSFWFILQKALSVEEPPRRRPSSLPFRRSSSFSSMRVLSLSCLAWIFRRPIQEQESTEGRDLSRSSDKMASSTHKSGVRSPVIMPDRNDREESECEDGMVPSTENIAWPSQHSNA
jgi:hypothetical protein